MRKILCSVFAFIIIFTYVTAVYAEDNITANNTSNTNSNNLTDLYKSKKYKNSLIFHLTNMQFPYKI